MISPSKFLVVGCGSIGRRHIRNLCSLGVTEIMAFDPAPESLAQVVSDFGVMAVTSLEGGLSNSPQAVVICTPPHLHLPTIQQAVEAGAHVFVEKPIANTNKGMDDILKRVAEQGLLLMVGYNLRFHPALQRIKSIVNGNKLGRIMTVQAEFGQYLPDWRPRQDYRQGYIVNAAMGGGIILDGSHELDYVRWLAGDVDSVYCVAGKLSALEMETEDTAFIVMRHTTGIFSEVHLDCTQRGYVRGCKVTGTNGTIIWEIQKGTRMIGGTGTDEGFIPIASNLDQTYVDEMKCFLACLAGKRTPPVDGSEGLKVLELALAARKSALTRQEIKL